MTHRDHPDYGHAAPYANLEAKLQLFLRERQLNDGIAHALLQVFERDRPRISDFVMLALNTYARQASDLHAIAMKYAELAPPLPFAVLYQTPKRGDTVQILAKRIKPRIGAPLTDPVATEDEWIPARVEAVDAGLIFTVCTFQGDEHRNPPMKLADRGKFWR